MPLPPPLRRIITTFRPSCPWRPPNPPPLPLQKSRVRHATADNARGGVLPVSFSISSCLTGNCKRSPRREEGFAHHHSLWSLAPCWGKIATVIAISCVFFFPFRRVNWIGSWRKTFWFPSNGECRLELQRQMEMISSKTTPKSLWWSRGLGRRIQQVPNSNGDERNIMKMLMGVCEGVRNHRGERHV